MFERDGERLIGQHYRDLVKAGKNPEKLAEQEGYRLQQIEGGITVVQTGTEEEGEGA